MRYYSESGLPLRRGTKFSAGLDLPFYDPNNETCTINPGEVVKVPTGVYLEPTPGVVAFLDSRSSTSKLKLDLMCRTIDIMLDGDAMKDALRIAERLYQHFDDIRICRIEDRTSDPSSLGREKVLDCITHAEPYDSFFPIKAKLKGWA